MYKVKKRWLTGYAILPCFTIKTMENEEGCELTCNNLLSTIFELFFAPFWSGKIAVTGSYEEV